MNCCDILFIYVNGGIHNNGFVCISLHLCQRFRVKNKLIEIENEIFKETLETEGYRSSVFLNSSKITGPIQFTPAGKLQIGLILQIRCKFLLIIYVVYDKMPLV